jgi:hypothetical protein
VVADLSVSATSVLVSQTMTLPNLVRSVIWENHGKIKLKRVLCCVY